jgi:C4-type Zn-finger protein
MSKLLKCPFCGGEAREYKQRFSFYGKVVDMACCDKCGFSLVKSVWNTRTPMANIVEKLEEMKMRYFLTLANTGDSKNDFAYENVGNALDNAINIVKQEINNGLE